MMAVRLIEFEPFIGRGAILFEITQKYQIASAVLYPVLRRTQPLILMISSRRG
jgi:hypothetical protein